MKILLQILLEIALTKKISSENVSGSNFVNTSFSFMPKKVLMLPGRHIHMKTT
jgi:hypothetical protein